MDLMDLQLLIFINLHFFLLPCSGVHSISDNADFTFDSSLVEDTTGKLLPNQLTVDNLTVEWVRKKMADLEVMLKECQTSLSNCDNCINRENR